MKPYQKNKLKQKQMHNLMDLIHEQVEHKMVIQSKYLNINSNDLHTNFFTLFSNRHATFSCPKLKRIKYPHETKK
jgi:hypothetical protein